MRLLLALIAAAVVAPPAAQAAVRVGIADQHPSAFSDARLRALNLEAARLVVPYDAATSEPATVKAWLDAVAAAGMTPHVAFEHLTGDRCPSRPCKLPSRAAYAAAVRAFIARFPQVRTYTAWNEANHVSQPTATNPEAAAGYYDELRAACAACTIVAGDVLDSGSYVRWLRRFQAATGSSPQLWGLHNYSDVTYGTTTGTAAVLAATTGTLWIEETGGIVVRRDASGRVLLASDEQRAAQAIDRAFALAATRPRIGRMYVYQWRAGASDEFDSGLVRPDGSARPSYATLLNDLKALAPTTVTWTASWSHGRLLLRGLCATACSGTATISLRGATGWRAATKTLARATRSYAAAAGHRASIRLRVTAKVRRRLRHAVRRRVVIVAAGARVRLALARPA
jgi:hypothetical protein